jgi:hypothetical protein
MQHPTFNPPDKPVKASCKDVLGNFNKDKYYIAKFSQKAKLQGGDDQEIEILRKRGNYMGVNLQPVLARVEKQARRSPRIQ